MGGRGLLGLKRRGLFQILNFRVIMIIIIFQAVLFFCFVLFCLVCLFVCLFVCFTKTRPFIPDPKFP